MAATVPAELESDSSARRRLTYVLAISGVAALGGLLFGYDTAVISGAIGYLERYLSLDAASKGWAASAALIGCILGAAIAGQMGDRLGRKPSLMICGCLFAVSALWSAVPHSLSMLATARILGGVGIGATSVLAPKASRDLRGLLDCWPLAGSDEAPSASVASWTACLAACWNWRS